MAARTASASSRPAGRALDPMTVAAAAFFLFAALAAAYPAFHAGRAGGAGLLLLAGLAGFCILGVFVVSTTGQAPAAAPDADPEAMVGALPEPSAVLSEDGAVVAANLAWREAWGAAAHRKLPRAAAEGLYAALAGARAEGAGDAKLATPQGVRHARAARLGARYLVRLDPADAPAPAAATPTPLEPRSATLAALAPAAMAAAASPAPTSLDGFAAAAPFGAALLDGPDVFAARIVAVNEAMARMSEGLAQRGRLFAALLDPASLDEARTRLKTRPEGPVEVRLGLERPRVAHLYTTAGEGRLVAYLLDVSEQKQLELQLAQSQKMQAIGQLAGGVAHDFNNLLTAIQLRLDELLHRHPVGDPSYEGLNEIRQTGVRAADLVRKLLAFSRKQTVQRETLELGSLMSEFEVLLRRLLREDVRLETDYGRDPPLVRADRAALETAVMNLAVNARDALRSHPPVDGGPGVVRIRTARLSQAEAHALGQPSAPPEGSALIEVADNGPGIAPDVADKIFEPFFTTKPVGEGTGLGLATVYGIVKQADGWIHVEPGVGQGAAFRVFLPIHQPSALQPAPWVAQAPPVGAPKPKPARDLSGAGRILFVEDEDAVRVVAARLLRARGYEVIEACDGEEALELAEVHTGQIDLLISDVIMPGLDGPTLLKKARRFLDGAKVMFISGYAEAEFSDLLEGEEGVTFLPKPLDIKVLAERVKQQLAG